MAAAQLDSGRETRIESDQWTRRAFDDHCGWGLVVQWEVIGKRCWEEIEWGNVVQIGWECPSVWWVADERMSTKRSRLGFWAFVRSSIFLERRHQESFWWDPSLLAMTDWMRREAEAMSVRGDDSKNWENRFQRWVAEHGCELADQWSMRGVRRCEQDQHQWAFLDQVCQRRGALCEAFVLREWRWRRWCQACEWNRPRVWWRESGFDSIWVGGAWRLCARWLWPMSPCPTWLAHVVRWLWGQTRQTQVETSGKCCCRWKSWLRQVFGNCLDLVAIGSVPACVEQPKILTILFPMELASVEKASADRTRSCWWAWEVQPRSVASVVCIALKLIRICCRRFWGSVVLEVMWLNISLSALNERLALIAIAASLEVGFDDESNSEPAVAVLRHCGGNLCAHQVIGNATCQHGDLIVFIEFGERHQSSLVVEERFQCLVWLELSVQRVVEKAVCGSSESIDHSLADLFPSEVLEIRNNVADQPSHGLAINVSAKCDAALSIGEAVSDQVEEIDPIVDMNERVGSSEDTTEAALNGTSVRNSECCVVHIVCIGVVLIHLLLIVVVGVGPGLRTSLDVWHEIEKRTDESGVWSVVLIWSLPAAPIVALVSYKMNEESGLENKLQKFIVFDEKHVLKDNEWSDWMVKWCENELRLFENWVQLTEWSERTEWCEWRATGH